VKKKKPVLHVEDLRVERGKTRILKALTWTVHPGEHWVILGANGSGKTSLLSALTGYLTPSGGEITLLGQRFGEEDWRELRRKVGIVSSAIRQKIPDWDNAELVVISGKYAMLDYWGALHKTDRREAARIMRLVECTPLATRDWAVLSQGERQRVLIGRALMASPEVLILDEPCAGLDPISREKFLHFLQRLACQKNAPTLLFVTHHVEEIFPALTHALVIRDGQSLAAGKKESVINSTILSRAYRRKVQVRRKGAAYTLKLVNLDTRGAAQ
jgi:iron complex transport system ATP-binding protein